MYLITNGSEELKRLEGKVEDFPLTFEIAPGQENSCSIYVQEQPHGVIFIQPAKGTFSELKFGGNVLLKSPKIYLERLPKGGGREKLFRELKVSYISFYKGDEFHISEEPYHP